MTQIWRSKSQFKVVKTYDKLYLRRKKIAIFCELNTYAHSSTSKNIFLNNNLLQRKTALFYGIYCIVNVPDILDTCLWGFGDGAYCAPVSQTSITRAALKVDVVSVGELWAQLVDAFWQETITTPSRLCRHHPLLQRHSHLSAPRSGKLQNCARLGLRCWKLALRGVRLSAPPWLAPGN